MKIIIVGCGKIGSTLAEQLSSEQHDLVVIDKNPQKIQQLSESIDVMGIVDNGASISVLSDAGIEDAHLLISVTGSDELNLLCCVIAKKVSKCHTIARVRNPLYNKERAFIRKSLGITMIINPELSSAIEISRLLRFPSAIELDTFAKGRVELLKFKLLPEFKLGGMTIVEIVDKLRNILICGVQRGKEVFIPSGNFVLQDNDLISIIASPKNSAFFFKKVGVPTHQVKNALIVGGGTLGYYLASLLIDLKIKVRIVENNPQRCQELSELLPEATIIHGDGTDKKLLLQEGLTQTEAFITLTSMDEENIFLSLFAKKNSKAKLVSKVTRISFDDIIDGLDIGSVIYPKYITADYILQYVRAMENSLSSSNVETLYHILDNQAEALEFAVKEASSITNTPLSQLNTKDNLLIACINRNGSILIPRGQDTIQVGDTVIIVTSVKGLNDLNDILKK